MMRSAKGKRKNKHDDEYKLGSSVVLDSRVEEIVRRDNLRRTNYEIPKIIKRGGYHNQSSLDQTKNYPIIPNP